MTEPTRTDQQGLATGIHLGMRRMLNFLREARTPAAMRIRLAATDYFLSHRNETVAAAAKRAGCSRQHFTKVLSEVRRESRKLSF